MARVRKREAAKRDLIAQWVWYAENASIEVADRFLSATEKTLASLSSHPESGTLLFVRKAELHFYLPLKDCVDLIRVAHGSGDLVRLFAEGFDS